VSNKQDHQALALAAVFQAAHMVTRVANEGKMDNDTLGVLLNTLFVQSPENIDAVFAHQTHALVEGYEQLLRYLENKQQRVQVAPDSVRYFLSILLLSIKLHKDQAMLAKLDEGIKACTRQKQHFGSTHENLIAGLAQLYQDSISTYRFRIQILGKADILHNDLNANRIRALLLAGIRCGVLWRQLGGSRWHLLLNKKGLANAAKRHFTLR
jgi:high frequency lysogenization protein